MERMSEQDSHVVVIGQDGQSVTEPGTTEAEGRSSIADMVSQPDKVMRIGTMIKQLLEEVRAAPLDEASRERLKRTHAASLLELKSGLTPDLAAELDRLALPFSDDSIPSDGELRIAQAQLVGWLEGLFHGIQTALFAQQMAARAQLEQMRGRALPPGAADVQGPQVGFPQPPPAGEPGAHSTGQYL